ncbi:MAG: alkaline phosphatase, partial [Candidatus Eisenbacteria bacterium]|nr:alkaline phosphatase [Candidatus Latescibacterota bacterium]MBD3302859.1 alkaline phosphatase [Candidatus Eisenbacteria bacterium]
MNRKSPTCGGRGKVPIALALLLIVPCFALGQDAPPTGSAIFIHPDGTGGQFWTAHRIHHHGPDGMSHWDRLERMGLYRSHVLDATNASSHGGATVHAYGVKVPFDTYGHCEEKPVEALSGGHKSIMQEARDAGLAIGLINSGQICEPGTGVFLAGAASRGMT